MIIDLNQFDFLRQEVNCFEIRHTFRESNSLADYLANKGCERSETSWFLLEDCRRIGVVEPA